MVNNDTNSTMSKGEIDNLLKIHWWGNKISKPIIDGWLDNFEENDKEIGEFLINNIIFYTSGQIESYVSQLILKMQADFYTETCMMTNNQINENVLYEKWKENMLKTRFIPMEKGIDAGTSANIIIRLLRNELNTYFEGEENKIVSKLDRIEEYLQNNVDKIVFVDDFSGTGNQMHDFLNEEVKIDGNNIKIKELPNKYPNVSFQINVLVLHDASMQKNKYDIEKFTVNYVESIDRDLDLRSIDCALYRGISDEKKKLIIEYIKNKSDGIMKENDKYYRMGKYQLGLPIVFEHGCPNNSCLLLFAKTDNWNRLFSLGEEST